MPELTCSGWVWVSLGAFLAGLSKSGIPGLGILMVAMMAAAMPTVKSTGVVLPLLLLSDILPVIIYRKHASWTHLFRLLPSACVGVFLGYFLLRHMTSWNDEIVRRMMGTTILLLLAAHAWHSHRAHRENSSPIWFAASMGILAGILTMVANAAGPVVSIYLLAMRLPKTEFVGTAACYFFLVNSFKIPFSASLSLITPETLLLNAVLAPFVLAGSVTGIFVLKRISQKVFSDLVLILAILAGVKLMI